MGIFRSRRKGAAEKPDMERLPRHIAIVMDGNGRWAEKRGLPRKMGHSAGAETFDAIATYCRDIGIKYLTVYAFSTENWKRPAGEIQSIMELLEKYLRKFLETMQKNRVKMKFFGDMAPLSPKLTRLIAEAEETSRAFTGAQVNICLNYGGRDEILRAAEAYAAACKAGADGPLTEERFAGYLFSKGVPDPDLVIRPSGEHRLSNFLLWQSAYAEFYFTDVLWPDFSKEEMNRAILAYQKRNRRFGAV